jgi:hypothetical protein
MTKTQRRKVVAWRVKEEHVEPLTVLVKKFLKTLGYTMYEKDKAKNKKGKTRG